LLFVVSLFMSLSFQFLHLPLGLFIISLNSINVVVPTHRALAVLRLDEARETYNMLPAARDCHETRRVFCVDILGRRIAHAALGRHGLVDDVVWAGKCLLS
jgi:hypothetical protein